MICYKDSTFCTQADNCSVEPCVRRFTDEDKQAAERIELPVSWALFTHCFKDKDDDFGKVE